MSRPVRLRDFRRTNAEVIGEFLVRENGSNRRGTIRTVSCALAGTDTRYLALAVKGEIVMYHNWCILPGHPMLVAPPVHDRYALKVQRDLIAQWGCGFTIGREP